MEDTCPTSPLNRKGSWTKFETERDMKNAKREYLMKKIAVAALMMGIYSPLAQAAVSPKDGVSLEELSQIVTDLEVQKDGNTIRFAGLMPKRCAESVIPLKADYRDGKHLIKISMPACDNDKGAAKSCEEGDQACQAGNELVDAADYLNEVKLKDADGELMLMHYKAGSRLASDRVQVQALADKDGKALSHVSAATIEQKRIEAEQDEAEKAAQAEDEAINQAKIERLEDLQAKVVSYCKDGDYAGLGQEIEMAADVLDDVTGLMENVAESQKKALAKKIEKSEDSEEAKEAYDAFVAAAAIHGWDEDDAKKKYIEKRFELLDELAADAKADDAKASEVDGEIRNWVKELRSLDKGEYRKQQGTFAKVYAELGTHAANKGAVEQAVTYYDKAKQYADAKGKMSMDGEAAKLYTKQFKECLAKNPGKMEVCDKYADQAKARASSIGDQLAANGTAEEVEGFKAEYISTFGGGMSVSAPGIGSVSPTQPGAFDQLKQQKYQEYMMQQQMLMQQRMMGIQPAAAPGSNFLGLK